jgi:phage shock protein C
MSSNVKKLYRSRKDRMIGGVCGGLAEYLSMDPTVIRILYILFALTGGSGILVYVILLLVIPEEPWDEALADQTKAEKKD